MRTLIFILTLIASLLITPSLSAATVSGEAQPTATKTEYFSGVRGTCYTMVKNKRTGKMVKRLVAKKYCAKK
jgi:ribosomal protein L33